MRTPDDLSIKIETERNKQRSPSRVALALALTIAMGLASRRPGIGLPSFVVENAGDSLWTVAVYLSLGLAVPKARPAVLAALAFLISAFVEFSQLLEMGWLVVLRDTQLGGLLLGTGFLWIDLVRYLIGALCALAIEASWRRWCVRPG